MWGGTGCGKTFIMDLFYASLPIQRKRRVHFNNFMIDIHKVHTNTTIFTITTTRFHYSSYLLTLLIHRVIDRTLHFNNFVIDIHQRLHRLKTTHDASATTTTHHTG